MEKYIGCSGYSYDDWKDRLYPDDLPKKEWLSYYADQFNSVEINNTFYSFPTQKNVKNWRDDTPAEFRFSIKANRFFTHLKKLKTDDLFVDKLNEFQKVLSPMKSKTGNILWQLPGNLHKDVDKLRSFANVIDRDFNHVIEFRHPTWFDETVYDLLRDLDISYCILSAPNGLPETLLATNKTAYLRFHGKSTWYDYLYSEKELEEWKSRMQKLRGVDRIYMYFNNDQHGNAIKNARNLMDIFQMVV